MSAYIVESAQLFVFTQNEQNGEACNLKGSVVPRLVETRSMSQEEPRLINMVNSVYGIKFV